MSFLSSAVFWGVIIILLGLSIILKEIFGVHIPVFRIFVGLILIYLGVKILAGGFWRHHYANSVVFNEANMNFDESQQDYNIVFGHGVIDLFKMDASHTNRSFDVNVVFGNGTLILNDSIPIFVEISSAFGTAIVPDKTINALGKSTFTTTAYKANEPYTYIKASVVFGRLDIQAKKW